MQQDNDQLCYDALSGRYFWSSKIKIDKAANVINYRLQSENTLALNEFYDELGLPPIELGDILGWNRATMHDILDISYSSHITDDDRTALVMEYNIAPTYDYYSLD